MAISFLGRLWSDSDKKNTHRIRKDIGNLYETDEPTINFTEDSFEENDHKSPDSSAGKLKVLGSITQEVHDKISIAIFQAGLTMIEGKRSTDVFIYALKFLQKAEHRTKDLSELSLIFQIEELIWGTDWNDDQAIIKLEKEFAEIFRKFKTLKGSKDTIKILHSSTNIKSTKS